MTTPPLTQSENKKADAQREKPTRKNQQSRIQALLTLLGLACVAVSLFVPESQRLSWVEVSILLVILLLNSDWETLTLSKDQFSMRRRVEEVEKKQEGQKKHNELLIKFVIDMLVTHQQVKWLRRLADDATVEYGDGGKDPELEFSYLQYDLRQLKSLYLIEEIRPTTGKPMSIRDMPGKGNLKVFFKITPRGTKFLELREQLKAILTGKE